MGRLREDVQRREKKEEKKRGDVWVREEVLKGLEESATARLLGALLLEENSLDSLVEDSLEVLVGLGRALDVLDRVELLCESCALLRCDGLLALGAELRKKRLVCACVHLGAHKDLGDIRAEVGHLRIPLGLHVLKGDRVRHREAHKEHGRIGIRKRTQTVVFLLTGSIPQTKLDVLVAGLNIDHIVIKNSRDVVLWELVVRIADQQTRLADSTITDNNKFDCDVCC